MTVKTIKVRKDHKCTVCKETILKGEMAVNLKTRIPVGENDEDWGFSQDGIEYLCLYRHPACEPKEFPLWRFA